MARIFKSNNNKPFKARLVVNGISVKNVSKIPKNNGKKIPNLIQIYRNHRNRLFSFPLLYSYSLYVDSSRVMQNSVKYCCGNDIVTEYITPFTIWGLLEAKMIEPFSYRLETIWKSSVPFHYSLLYKEYKSLPIFLNDVGIQPDKGRLSLIS